MAPRGHGLAARRRFAPSSEKKKGIFASRVVGMCTFTRHGLSSIALYSVLVPCIMYHCRGWVIFK
jgi:hypothetical protein